MLKFFAEKNVSSFCSATHIFSAKNFRKLYIESAKTVNEITLNELVKLTTRFEQLGPGIRTAKKKKKNPRCLYAFVVIL